MNTDANKRLITQYLDAWEQGDTDALKRMLSPDAVTHVSATRDERSHDFEPDACAAWVAAFPDTQLTVKTLVAEGDSVAVYWEITATHKAEFVGIPATDKTVTFGGLEINRIKDGKIVEIWRLSDTMTLMGQLGAMG